MIDDFSAWHVTKPSPLHGMGVFAARPIPAGTMILEYEGVRISPEAADAQEPDDPDDPCHTFFFSLSSGEVIDGARDGNDARWINHSCEPNCQAEEDEDGRRVYIVALRDIAAGEELTFDYGLIIDEPMTDALREEYRCHCGAPGCRGAMLAPPAEDDAGNEAQDSNETT